jgi:hypothetical protein
MSISKVAMVFFFFFQNNSGEGKNGTYTGESFPQLMVIEKIK